MIMHPANHKVFTTQKIVDEFLKVDPRLPYVFGKNDCVHLIAKHLVNFGYKDYLADITYSDAKTAKKAIRALGVKTLEEFLDTILEPIPHSYAMCGDVVEIPTHDDDAALRKVGLPALGILLTQHRVLAIAGDGDIEGFNLIPAFHIVKAWRVKAVA